MVFCRLKAHQGMTMHSETAWCLPTGADLQDQAPYLSKINGYLSKPPSIFGKNEEEEGREKKRRK
jgi:hypothetical protein